MIKLINVSVQTSDKKEKYPFDSYRKLAKQADAVCSFNTTSKTMILALLSKKEAMDNVDFTICRLSREICICRKQLK